MTTTAPRPGRRSVRMAVYDYSAPGLYFVTACIHERRCLLGEIVGEHAVLNDHGRAVEACWQEIPDHFPGVDIDAFVVMPNHVHGILWIAEPLGATGASLSIRPDASPPRAARGPARRSLGAIVGSFKAAAAQRMNRVRGTPGAPVWQRSYYEHVIRDEQALERIRQYIADNPRLWAEDAENPDVVRRRGL